MLNGIYFPFVDLLSTVALAVVLGYGGHLYFAGSISLGTLFAFMLYVQNFFDPVQQLSQLYNSFLSAAAALDKILGVLDETPEVEDRPAARDLPRIDGHVRFEGVRFSYGTRRGGAARARPRRARRDDGGARRAHRRRQVDDREAARPLLRADARPHHRRRRRPERRHASARCAPSSASYRRRDSCSRAPWPRTSRSAGRTRPRRRSSTPRRPSARTSSCSALEDGYETQLGERGSRLSLGQRQLVAFARALLADPRILVLDEATSSVDIGTEQKIEEALRVLLADRTAFIIAHRLSTIRDADLIVVLEHGRDRRAGLATTSCSPPAASTRSLYGDWAAA